MASFSVTDKIEISFSSTVNGLISEEIVFRLPGSFTSFGITFFKKSEPGSIETANVIRARTPTAIPTKAFLFNDLRRFTLLLNVELKRLIVKTLENNFMQYHQAVKIGQERARKSQMNLFNHAGFAMLTLTVKKSEGKFVPVGEQEFVAVVNKPEGWVTVIVDEEGYAKAQSKVLEESDAREILKKAVAAGILEYIGKVKLV